jgi:hypothetical protein
MSLRIARSTNATGFIVGCRSFFTGFIEEPDIALVPRAAPEVVRAFLPAIEGSARTAAGSRHARA